MQGNVPHDHREITATLHADVQGPTGMTVRSLTHRGRFGEYLNEKIIPRRQSLTGLVEIVIHVPYYDIGRLCSSKMPEVLALVCISKKQLDALPSLSKP